MSTKRVNEKCPINAVCPPDPIDEFAFNVLSKNMRLQLSISLEDDYFLEEIRVVTLSRTTPFCSEKEQFYWTKNCVDVSHSGKKQGGTSTSTSWIVMLKKSQSSACCTGMQQHGRKPVYRFFFPVITTNKNFGPRQYQVAIFCALRRRYNRALRLG